MSDILELRRLQCQKNTRGLTLFEVMLATAILITSILALYAPLSRAFIQIETNKQIKLAVFDAQSIVEEIQGCEFDAIMDPDWPSFDNPMPRYRHLQYVPTARIFGTNPSTGLSNPAHLEDEKIRVWYGSQLDSADSNNNGDKFDALPLPIVPGSDLLTNLTPTPANPIEQNRPANTPGQSQFVTPEPLYVTVEVSWLGPVRSFDLSGNPQRMVQRITFVRSR